jgi:hypothetical protein
MRNDKVMAYLKETRHRLLTFEMLDGDTDAKRDPAPPNRFRATIYDYTNNRAITARGDFDHPDRLDVTDSAVQPLPSSAEFEAALEVLQQDASLGPAIRDKRLRPYPPMPPLVDEELPDGRIERTLAVGLRPDTAALDHEIVGVNLIHNSVVRFQAKAPARALANNSTCGLPDANQPTASRGTVGGVNVTVLQGNTVLWTFTVVRPASSSGVNGSGVELRFVNYRGKRVLYRAHVPILNVRYNGNACGPYRDWQWQEGMLQANGTDITAGFRYCPTPAQTILENGTDVGDYLGVAIFVQGQEVVLVSEMQAGWYRYVSEWRLHANGTITPRFGFGAVQSSCVCNIHHHHVYWRLDFDIRTAGGNVVREYNNPPIFPNTNWHTKYYEIRRLRDPSRHRKWRVLNARTGEAYDLIPGATDGTADATYGLGDVWVLRYHGNEIDDSAVASSTVAALDRFVNGESVFEQDVVLWYAAHFTHNVQESSGEMVGPTLSPVNWRPRRGGLEDE